MNDTGTFQVRFFQIGGQIGTHCEKAILDMAYKHPIRFIGQISDKHSQVSVQLVYCAVCFQTNVGFRNPVTAYQRSGTFITGFSIYFHKRLVFSD